MKLYTIYVETSVWNAPFSKQAPEFRRIGEEFFLKADSFYLYISTLVIVELNRCSEPKRTGLFSLIKRYKPIEIEINQDAVILAEKYIKGGVIPERYFPDALHIAVASVNKMDYIVSLNFSHIVCEMTRNTVIGINTINGYSTPKIVSPGEL